MNPETNEQTSGRMSRSDAMAIVRELNECQRKHDESKSERTQRGLDRMIAQLVQQLTAGDRIVNRDPERSWYVGQWWLVLTEEERADDEARMAAYRIDSMKRELDRAKADYRRTLENTIERLQREIALVDADDVRGSSPYGYSGAHDLPILRESIERLTALVKFAETGEYNW